jgi:hypothetical protein
MSISFEGTSRTLVPGVFSKSEVVLNSRLRGFLAALRWKAGFDIVVTSGVRTTAAQAAAMRTKVIQGGTGELSIYSAKLRDEVIAGGTDTTAGIKATLDSQVSRGVYMSRHMRGDAIDLRTSGMESDRLKALQAAVKALGANQLLEATPPHLHIEDIPSQFAAMDPAAVGGAAALAAFLWWGFGD